MMEQSQRLYDCITEIGEEYLEEAWNLVPEQRHTPLLNWKRWTTLAASLLLAVGIGLVLPRFGMGGGTKSESPACSAPAASAPAAAAPELMDEETGGVEAVSDGSQVGGSGNTRILQAGQQVAYPDGRVGILLSEEEAEKQGMILTDDLNWEGPVLYLEYRDGMYRPTDTHSEIVLYTCGDGFGIIRNGELYIIVQIQP